MRTSTPSTDRELESGRSKVVDATRLLSADHKEVKRLFKEYDKLVKSDAADDPKQALAEDICHMLTVHATIEEEVFYPAAREALDDPGLIDEATVEHATAKDLIAQIRAMTPGDALYDATVKVLAEYIDHHVSEEEDEIFPKLKRTSLDLKELGAQLAQRKQQLANEMM